MKKYQELEVYNPIAVISAIQKTKFKFAALPIALVLLSVIISSNIPFQGANFLAMLGLALYLLVLMLFRVNRRWRYLEAEPTLVFPINGKIIACDADSLVIRKRIFEPAEIRWAGEDFSSQNLQGKVYIFEPECKIVGRLIGVAPLGAICRLQLPPEKMEKYKVGMRLQAGQEV
ncbi:MAG: hypothetical protein R6U84_08295 [Candidatus Cloacimonadales bacterium]